MSYDGRRPEPPYDTEQDTRRNALEAALVEINALMIEPDVSSVTEARVTGYRAGWRAALGRAKSAIEDML